MPYTKDGIIPDILFNPHGMPSRMTVAQLLEELCGLYGALTGKIMDGTPFEGDVTSKINDVMEMLHELGYEKHGWQRLYHGYTSEPIEALVFMTPTYYQRLKHMVKDKIHSRSHGPRQNLTRQPLEGRARDGGLRFGEMERDNFISQGTSRHLQERLSDMSDKFTTHVCSVCHLLAEANKTKGYFYCRYCDDYDSVVEIDIPYACKLLFQELMAMNMVPFIIV